MNTGHNVKLTCVLYVKKHWYLYRSQMSCAKTAKIKAVYTVYILIYCMSPKIGYTL